MLKSKKLIFKIYQLISETLNDDCHCHSEMY